MNRPLLRVKTHHILDDVWINLPRGVSAADYQKLMWPDDVLQHILVTTNSTITNPKHKLIRMNELHRYFGQLLILSVFPLSEFRVICGAPGTAHSPIPITKSQPFLGSSYHSSSSATSMATLPSPWNLALL